MLHSYNIVNLSKQVIYQILKTLCQELTYKTEKSGILLNKQGMVKGDI